VVVLVEGRLRVVVGDDENVLEPGDAVILPAGRERRMNNAGDVTVVALSAAPPGALATVGANGPVPVPWAS